MSASWDKTVSIACGCRFDITVVIAYFCKLDLIIFIACGGRFDITVVIVYVCKVGYNGIYCL
jgi:hypothetical protein